MLQKSSGLMATYYFVVFIMVFNILANYQKNSKSEYQLDLGPFISIDQRFLSFSLECPFIRQFMCTPSRINLASKIFILFARSVLMLVTNANCTSFKYSIFQQFIHFDTHKDIIKKLFKIINIS